MRLKDRVTLITGGAAGIGMATAQRFAEEGAEVIICDVNKEHGQAAVQTLEGEAGQAMDHSFYKVDVTDRNAVQKWVDEVVEKYGCIDVLVNNAGLMEVASTDLTLTFRRYFSCFSG